jgi:GH35 family endo-1,4-beta-xylanase
MKTKNIVTVLLVALILVSCASAAKTVPTETALPTSTFTPIPTATSTATPIPTISKERFPKGFLEIALPTQGLIEQGMKTGVIRQTIDIDKLIFDVHDNLNKPSQQIVFGRNPETQEIILATRIDPVTGEMSWHVAGLRDLADTVGITIGSQLYSPRNGLYSDSDIEKINELVTQEYNHAIVIEVGWAFLEKYQENQFDFRAADAAVNLALANGMTVEGDDVIYGKSDYNYSYLNQIEAKLRDEGLNDEQIKTRLDGIVRNNIQKVVTHFKGRITEWSVLNEWSALDYYTPDFYSRIWQNDDEFVKMVFEETRKADPTARLFYNDADNYTRGRYNYSHNVNLIKFLQQFDLIDAMGIQFTDIRVADHINKNEIIATMESYNIPIIVSSAQFNIEGVSGTDEEVQKQQAAMAVDILDACVQVGCRDFRMWAGYGDKFNDPGTGKSIFDENMKPKLAYFAIKEYLTQMIEGNASK